MSPMIQSLLLLALSSLALATSKTTLKSTTTKSSTTAAPKTTVYSISEVAEFDNVSNVQGSGGPVGSGSIYQLLKYNGFSLLETEAPNGAGTIPGIDPQSSPNYISFGQGDSQTILQGTPAITVNYPDSSVLSFALKSFYYGCALNTEESLAGVPISCTITVKGYGPPSSGSKLLASQSFAFVSNGGLSQDMTKGVFSSTFTGLYSAVFTLSSAQTNLTAALLDNISEVVSSKNPVTVN